MSRRTLSTSIYAKQRTTGCNQQWTTCATAKSPFEYTPSTSTLVSNVDQPDYSLLGRKNPRPFLGPTRRYAGALPCRQPDAPRLPPLSRHPSSTLSRRQRRRASSVDRLGSEKTRPGRRAKGAQTAPQLTRHPLSGARRACFLVARSPFSADPPIPFRGAAHWSAMPPPRPWKRRCRSRCPAARPPLSLRHRCLNCSRSQS